MSLQCRTCAKVIYNKNPTNIFVTANFQVLSNIQAIAGTVLERVPGLSMHICACCLIDVKRAVFHAKTFRERCNRTQKQLKNLLESKDLFNKDEQVSPKLDEDAEDTLLELEVDSANEDSEYKVDFLIDSEANSNDTNNSSFRGQASEEESISDLYNDLSNELDERTIAENQDILISSELKDTKQHSPKVKRYKSWKNLSQEQIVERKRQQRRRECICDQCGKHFTDQSNFKLHMIRHTGIKKFECQRCLKRFYTDHLLQMHKRVVHQGERPYGCKYCDKTFHNSTTRAIHERNHTNVRPYSCEYCEKAFKAPSCLKRHLLTHNGLRNYFCEICHKDFQRNTHLKAHLKSKLHALKASENSVE